MSEQDTGAPNLMGLLTAVAEGHALLTGEPFAGEETLSLSGRYCRWIDDTRFLLLGFPGGICLAAEWVSLCSPLFTFDPCSLQDSYDPCDLAAAVQQRNAWLGRLASELRSGGSGTLHRGQPGPGPEPTPKDSRTVFVVHGRNQDARKSMFAFLRAIGLTPLEWSVAVQVTGKPTPYIGEILDSAFGLAQAVVVLMTPDDEAQLRPALVHENDPPHEKDLTPQARPNVIFEAGMAMGRFPDRTVLVELGTLRPFSDIGGRHTIRLDDSPQRRQEFAQRLQAAGCPVNLEGTDWHTTGNFALGTCGEP